MKTRAEAVEVARSWLGTPYVKGARVKGGGCDCGTWLAEYLIEIGRATENELQDLGFFSHDWFCHASSELYFRRVMQYGALVAETKCRPAEKAEPGDLILVRAVRSPRYNHGAVVTKWPWGIHAADGKVRESDLTTHRLTGWREMAIFDPFVTLNREGEPSVEL